MQHRVLFVCHGNICRSPMAEYIFKDMVEKRGLQQVYTEIASRAVSTEETGRPVYPPARAELARHGIGCSHHAARQITRADFQHYDLIYAMDKSNFRLLRALVGSELASRVRPLLPERDIADPWYTGNFSETYRDIVEGCEKILGWQIRKAGCEELDSLMPVYERSRQFMRQAGNAGQWINGYPSREVLASDIAAGNLYVCEEMPSGSLLAVFAFVPGPDSTYSHIEDGVWPDNKPYYVVHRIASTLKRKGVARFCFEWCLSRHPVLRIDTHADNIPMLKLLEREGFIRCGIIYVADGSPRTAFQKNSSPIEG